LPAILVQRSAELDLVARRGTANGETQAACVLLRVEGTTLQGLRLPVIQLDVARTGPAAHENIENRLGAGLAAPSRHQQHGEHKPLTPPARHRTEHAVIL